MFSDHLAKLRALGRKVVLPSEKIKELVTANIPSHDFNGNIVDLGAGTMYWSKWLSENFNSDVLL